MRVEVFTLMTTKEIEMGTKKIYGDWIKWHGGKCPVPPDAIVAVKLRCGTCEVGYRANGYRWRHAEAGDDIISYHTITEQPDLDAAEQLLRANGYTVTPPAKPLTFEDVVPMTEAPPEGTVYWVVSPTGEGGVYRAWIRDRASDDLVIKRRMAYLEKEHALIAARHIFGLKGGEL